MNALFRCLFGDPTTCRCGHPRQWHEHHRPGDDCGGCGPDVCGRFRPRRRGEPTPPVDLAAVCRDDQLVEAIRAGDLDGARLITTAEHVALLAALADSGRQP